MSTRAHTVPKFYLDGFVDPHVPAGHTPSLWIGDLATGSITRRSPRNVSVVKGFYDGPAHRQRTIESVLSDVESHAAAAIRAFVARPTGRRGDVPNKIGRFLAWQAARTPAMLALFQKWLDEDDPNAKTKYAEPPPPGFERIKWVERKLEVVDPKTGVVEEVMSGEVAARQRAGWRWRLRRDDWLELVELQAWYFGVRFLPRLKWIILEAPPGTSFITSDRPVAWGFDGVKDAEPSTLRDLNAMVLAPLTKRVTLVGVNRVPHTENRISPHTVNKAIVALATKWIAGSSRDCIESAMAANGVEAASES